MSCGPRDAAGDVVMCSWPDKPFRDSVESLIRPDLAAVCIMHSEVPDVAAGLELVRTKWLFENIITPEDYVARAAEWKEASSISIMGGCCGLRPDHIRALKSHFG
jgi:methionine synthase I (cobalamin-dependent)